MANQEALTEDEVFERIDETIQDMQDDMDADDPRNSVIERIEEEADAIWGSIFWHGPISEWDVTNVGERAGEWAIILQLGRKLKITETDKGLWDGLTHQVPVAQSFFTLRNIFFHRCSDEWDIDLSEDYPLIKAWTRNKIKQIEDCPVHLAFIAGVIRGKDDDSFGPEGLTPINPADPILEWIDDNYVTEELAGVVHDTVIHARNAKSNSTSASSEGATGHC